ESFAGLRARRGFRPVESQVLPDDDTVCIANDGFLLEGCHGCRRCDLPAHGTAAPASPPARSPRARSAGSMALRAERFDDTPSKSVQALEAWLAHWLQSENPFADL